MQRMRQMKKPCETEEDLKLFESNGLKCAIVRHPEFKHLCGYVELPENHPWGLIEELTWDCPADVHGGITFDGVIPEIAGHVIGFDCIHAGDSAPGMLSYELSEIHGDTYKTMLFVENECRKLAEQIRAAEK